MAVETCVPLMSASPSLGPSASGSSSSRCSASAAGMISPWSAIRPCPNMAAERWARGARSPDAPTEPCAGTHGMARSEEHTSELQSLMRISYAVFCLKKKKTKNEYNDQLTTLQKYAQILNQLYD